MATKILIVDDEKDIGTMLEYNLKKSGFRTLVAYDGDEACTMARREQPHLIVLDVMLPTMTGLDVCRLLKQDKKTSHIPIIMLTAKSQEADKVAGLELGADDYVTKPFSPRELIARVNAVLRRTHEKGKKESPIITVGKLAIDCEKIIVTLNGKLLELTAKEFELLKTLVTAQGRVLSREHLLDTVWGFDRSMEIQTRTVDVHIRTLRKKLRTEAQRIITVKNYGYRFETKSS